MLKYKYIILLFLLTSCDAIKIIDIDYKQVDSMTLKKIGVNLYGYTRMNTDYYMVIHYDFKDTVLFKNKVEINFRDSILKTINYITPSNETDFLIGKGEVFFDFYVPNKYQLKEDTLYERINDKGDLEIYRVPDCYTNLKDTFYINMNNMFSLKNDSIIKEPIKYYVKEVGFYKFIKHKSITTFSSGGKVKKCYKKNNPYHEIIE